MREKEREIQILDERSRERYKFGRLKYNRKMRKRKQRKENVKLTGNQNLCKVCIRMKGLTVHLGK